MKKYLTFNLVKICFLACSFMIAGFASFAQDTPKLTMKPYMWVAKMEGQEQVNRFNSLKLEKISARLGVNQTNNFKLENLLGMISYFEEYYPDFKFLHVYIGVGTGNSAPIKFRNKIVLIFAPASSDNIKSDSGYYILSEYFDPKNANNFKISLTQKEEWTQKYVDIMPLDDLEKDDPLNFYPSNESPNKIISDTRHVTYCKGDLSKLIYAKNIYSTKHDLSNNLIGYLGAYSSEGVILNGKAHYKNRNLILFELTDNRGREFYLETVEGFDHLDPEQSSCPLSAVDKGMLCPTHCP